MNTNKSVIVLYEKGMWNTYGLPINGKPLATMAKLGELGLWMKKYKYNMVGCFNDEDFISKIKNKLSKINLAELYLDWVNNYLTIDRMAEHYGISNSVQLRNMLEEGKKQHEVNAKLFKYESKSSVAIGRVNLVIEEIDHLSKDEQHRIKLLTEEIIEIINNSQPEVI